VYALQFAAVIFIKTWN